MGRKERRAKERRDKKALQRKQADERTILNYMKSRSKIKDLTKKEIDKISEDLNNIQLGCTMNAMAMVLHDKYQFTPEKTADLLEEMAALTSQIGTSEEYPNPSEFKIKCALATGIDIALTKEEKSKVMEIYKIAWEGEESDEYSVETE